MIMMAFSQFDTVIAMWLKSLMLINPLSFLFLGAMIIFWLSLKTLTAKLVFLGGGLLVSSVVTYFVYRNEKKQINLNKKKKFEDNFTDIENKTIKVDSQEQELKLSRLFKK